MGRQAKIKQGIIKRRSRNPLPSVSMESIIGQRNERLIRKGVQWFLSSIRKVESLGIPYVGIFTNDDKGVPKCVKEEIENRLSEYSFNVPVSICIEESDRGSK
jgi:hypothetical protein